MPLTRRQLLLTGTAAAALAACGGGSSEPKAKTDGLLLYAAFRPEAPVGQPARFPLALAAADGSLDLDRPPATIDVALRSPDGTTTELGTVKRHARGIPRGYYPVHATLPAAGAWTFVVTAGAQQLTTKVTAQPAGALASVPGPGDVLPRIPTPTVDNHRGVRPICTRDPQCPFHAVSLDAAIGKGGPIVFLVSTPAYCQTAICGPVLDLVVARRSQLEAAGATVIHAEVYVDDKAQQTTDAVNALGLTYEPALFLAAPDGTVNERLDYTFDATELSEALSRLLP